MVLLFRALFMNQSECAWLESKWNCCAQHQTRWFAGSVRNLSSNYVSIMRLGRRKISNGHIFIIVKIVTFKCPEL